MTDRTGWQGLAEWRGETGRRWATITDTTEEQLGHLGRAAMDRLGLTPGQRVLDVGCGAGATTAALAAAVAPGGTALGVDVSPVLVAQARTQVQAGLDYLEADASTHPFPAGGFDAVFSRLGVMFFEDPPAAFANLRRATREGGRLAFACWQARERNPALVIPARSLVGLVPMAPPAPPGAPSPFSLDEPERVGALLDGAGWRDVHVEPLTWNRRVAVDGGDPATAARRLLVGGVAGMMLADAPPETVSTAVSRLVELLPPPGPDGSIELAAAAWVVSATA